MICSRPICCFRECPVGQVERRLHASMGQALGGADGVRVEIGPTFVMPHEFDATGLHVHQQSAEPAPDVVVFTHGLGGSGRSTWASLPSFVVEGGEGYDVALFDYASAGRRFRWSIRMASMRFYIEQLLSGISNLAAYERIHLVGHSLGGLVNEAAAREYLGASAHSGGDSGPLRPLASLTYFASPRLGTRWVPRGVDRVLPEFRMLSLLSTPGQESERFFTDNVTSDLRDSPSQHRAWMPRFVCYAGDDRLVSKYSATFSIPTRQHLPLRGSHTSIVKPDSGSSPQVVWLLANLSAVNGERQRITEERYRAKRQGRRIPAPPALVTELWATEIGRWDAIYNDVRSDCSSPQLPILDSHDADGRTVNLLVALSDSADIVSNSEQERAVVISAAQRARESAPLTVGLASIGDDHVEARAVIDEWVATEPLGSLRVSSAVDDQELKLVLATWIRNIAMRDPRRRHLFLMYDSEPTVTSTSGREESS